MIGDVPLGYERETRQQGNSPTDTNPGFQPFGFQSGLYDPDTALVQFGARWYDPATGRWLSKDSILLKGGLNLYVFCGNDPVNAVDPWGLAEDNEGSYFGKSVGQLFKGNYAEDVTLLGTGMQIGAGLVGIDALGDFRDLWYDLSHWTWSWGHAGNASLDVIGVFPVVGVAKYADEFGDLVTGAKNIKRLSPGEIQKLIKGGVHPHDFKINSNYDLFKDSNGNIIVKPKNGSGPGELTGYNINDY